jgi:hypothetical protein
MDRNNTYENKWKRSLRLKRSNWAFMVSRFLLSLGPSPLPSRAGPPSFDGPHTHNLLHLERITPKVKLERSKLLPANRGL